MARLIDRMLARNVPYPGGYNEAMYSGAEYAGTWDTGAGGNREGPPVGLVRMAREAMASNGIVFAVQALRMALFSEARFQFMSMTDGHLFGNPDLKLLEHPWPNADS